MKGLFFWKEWPQPYQNIYLSFLVVFILTAGYFVYSIILEEHNALEWLITSTMNTLEVPFKTISVGLFEIELALDNYLINQYYQGSAHQITPQSGYFFLLIFATCLIVLLAITTYLKKFWYLVSMTFMSFILVSFRFEQLEIFGWIDNTFLLIVLALTLPLSYCFQSFKKESSLITRVLVFLGLFLLLAIIIYFFSKKSNPFYFLIHYSHVSTVVLSILFIFLVSHEIIYFILYFVSGSDLNTGKDSSKHFIALSLIYLLNVGLLYLKNAFIIDWDILYINAFVLLLISSFIGIWGFKRRENLYQHLFAFQPTGAIFFLTLGTLCFSTITYHTITLNDPILETLEDAIVYAHIGFGIMFFFYIIANFINLLTKGLAVYKVAYKEDNMPYFSTNLAGLAIVAAFYYLSNQAALQQAIAGYYNGLGNVYRYEGENFLAEEYYKRGAIFGYNNHRSNYSIGELAYHQNDLEKAITRFKNATIKNPTEFAYVNLANAQKENYLFFDALFTLKDGLREFPNSGKIKNNLGLIFKETKVLDSAIYYMESGAEGHWGNNTNQTNIIDILARNRISLPHDSLARVFDQSDHLPIKSNLLGYSNATGNWLKGSSIPETLDSALDIHQFAYLFNLYAGQSEPQKKDIELIKAYAQSSSYRSPLNYLAALLTYRTGNISAAFREIDQLTGDPVKKGYYHHVMGLIALEQRAPKLAADFFAQALESGYPSAEVNLAIAVTESGQSAQAIGLWNKLLTEDSLGVANDLLVALTAPKNLILNSESDALKYQAIRYGANLDPEEVSEVVSTMSDEFKVAVLQELTVNHIKKDNYDEARKNLTLLRSFNNRFNIRKTIDSLENNLLHHMVADRQLALEELDLNDVVYTHWRALDTPYFEKIAYQNPFAEDQVKIASRYFAEEQNDPLKAYDILLKAIEINPHTIRLIKAYILRAIDVGLEHYAQPQIERLREMTDPGDFQIFMKEAEARKVAFDDFTFPIISE